VQQRRLRSVLCLPLIKQTKLVGALYLDNNLTSHAFTPDRIAVLELLARKPASRWRMPCSIPISSTRKRGYGGVNPT